MTKQIQGVKVANSAPPITHLLFADDFLVFTKANLSNINAILNITNEFSLLSGQVINFDKSSIHFNNNLSENTCDTYKQILKVRSIEKSDKYLGTTLLLGRSKVDVVKNIHDNFDHRLKGWNGKSLNQDGRFIMVKHVLNTLRSYHMSNFKLPKTLLKKLTSLQRKLW